MMIRAFGGKGLQMDGELYIVACTSMIKWLYKFVKNPKRIGSIAPSSKFLAELMTRDIRESDVICELGPGSGAITEYILNKTKNPGNLVCVEADHEFARMCREKFGGVTVLETKIESFFIQQNRGFDAIISGIPFANYKTEERLDIFRKIHNLLNKDGRFIMFQYSTLSNVELKRIFDNVHTEFTPFNIPPAFVHICKK